MAKMYQAIKLISMLIKSNELDAKKVAQEFEVSIRTAQRMLSELEALPFISCEGDNPKILKLNEKAPVNSSLFNPGELSIVNALFGYAASLLSGDNKEQFEYLRAKLLHNSMTENCLRFMGDSMVAFDKVVKAQVELEKAIRCAMTVTFTYNRYEKKEYTVNPYRLIVHEGFWYLVAEHEGKLKKYLLEYISDVDEGMPFTPNEEIKNAADSADTIWFKNEEGEEVVILVPAELADYFRRRNILHRQEIVQNGTDDGVHVRFRVYGERDLLINLQHWLPYVSVVSPQKYRTYLRELGEKMLANNA